MSDIPRRLKQLGKQLASLDDDEAMLLSELDGSSPESLSVPT